jgi:hypothetical protein
MPVPCRSASARADSPRSRASRRIDRACPPELPAGLPASDGRHAEYLGVLRRNPVIRPHVHHHPAAISPPREEIRRMPPRPAILVLDDR